MKSRLLVVTSVSIALGSFAVIGQEENTFDNVVPPRIVLTKEADTFEYEINDQVTVQDVLTQTGIVTQTRIEAGGQTPHHNHPEEETIVMVSGRLKVVLADREIIAEDGDVVNIESYAEHHLEALEDTFYVGVFGPGRAIIQ